MTSSIKMLNAIRLAIMSINRSVTPQDSVRFGEASEAAAAEAMASSRLLTPDNETDDDGVDYTLNDEATGAWISYRGRVIHIYSPFEASEILRIDVSPPDYPDTILGQLEVIAK